MASTSQIQSGNEIADLSTFFLAAGNSDGTKIVDLLHKALDLGVSFKTSEGVSNGIRSDREHVSFENMPAEGISYEALLQEFSDIAARSSNWGSPNFMGFPDAGNNAAGLAASVFTPLLNQNMANQDICSPDATFKEMEVVHWLREALGYSVPPVYSKASEIGGILTLGGCLSNTIALVAAREKTFPGCGLKGLPVPASKVRVLVPNVIEHYSIRSAMAWLSLGEHNVVRVPVDDRFRMDLDALRRVIHQEREDGNTIIACIAYAGDSRSMRIDNLEAIANIVHELDIWFHVDACHGSQLAFSDRHRSKLRGIEFADSITIDPHKVLFLPYTCSLVLFKDPKAHAATATNSDLILNTQWSLGRITPFIGSKAFDVLKLWATIKFFGKRRLGQLIDERLDLTHAIQAEIESRPDLVLLNVSDINSCMMMFLPKQVQRFCISNGTRLSDSDLEKLNKLNHGIKEAIRQKGKFYVHGFPLKSCAHESFLEPEKQVYVLRTMNGNPATTLAHARNLLDRIESIGWDLFDQSEYQLMSTEPSTNRLSRAENKLAARLDAVFGEDEYVGVVYGSSAHTQNSLLSDIDLMIFARHAPSGRSKEIEEMFRQTMAEEGIMIDAEVPFERKLLITMPDAQKAAIAGPPLDSHGRVLSIRKTAEYLGSNEMVGRLVFNVLTTPTKVIASRGAGTQVLRDLEQMAGHRLWDLINQVNPDAIHSVQDFVRLAHGDGLRSGEEYLGYKLRSNVFDKLGKIYAKHQIHARI